MNSPMYLAFAVLALLISFVSPISVFTLLALVANSGATVAATVSATRERQLAPRLAVVVPIASALLLTVTLLIAYAKYFVHWTF